MKMLMLRVLKIFSTWHDTSATCPTSLESWALENRPLIYDHVDMTRLSIQSEMGCDDVRCENSKVDPFLRWVVKLNTIKTYNSNKYISSWENKNKTKKCFFFSLQLDRDHSVFFSGVIMVSFDLCIWIHFFSYD